MKRFIIRHAPRWLVGWYHLSLGFLGALIYGFPSRKLIVIGVTGTNGKTTVVQLTSHILKTAGYAVGHISSVDFKIGPARFQNDLKITMPGRFFIQRMLRRMVREGCRYAVIEVTSEGILQHRHRYIDFDVAVLTNVTPEHLERHGGFEQYRSAKGRLFASLKQKNAAARTVSVINLDDPNASYFLESRADEKWGYAISLKLQSKVENIIIGENLDVSGGTISFKVEGVSFKLPLMGEFNIANALAAIAVCRSQGVSLEVIKKACASFPGVPGRMEVVVKEPFTVIVDYGHTPDALEKVYKTIQETYQLKAKSRKLLCVFGSTGGGRDRWKRPEMGKVAAEFCDHIILTNDDPYDENPEAIIDEIEQGILSSKNHELEAISSLKIVDRRKAIQAAIERARPGDAVIITGKGAEPWLMGPNGTKIPWDDRKIARDAAGVGAPERTAA